MNFRKFKVDKCFKETFRWIMLDFDFLDLIKFILKSVNPKDFLMIESIVVFEIIYYKMQA